MKNNLQRKKKTKLVLLLPQNRLNMNFFDFLFGSRSYGAYSGKRESTKNRLSFFLPCK